VREAGSLVAVDAATTLRFGVAGHPVEHSLSPQMHEAAYRELGIDAVYQRLPIRPELFAETVRALPGSGFAGINVTIPHKHAAAELADSRSAAVEAIGAANTLTFVEGRVHAENTDAPGLIAAIGRPLEGMCALVLGAGGTARAAVWALREAGAAVEVFNRTSERAAVLADQLGATAVFETDGGGGYELIVNTTAVGMDPAVSDDEALAALRLDPAAIAADALVVDFVYRVGETPLVAAAKARGLTVVDGRELLVRQGALSFELWFARPAPLEAMRAALTP
jgi:shikimate dehydrogenase